MGNSISQKSELKSNSDENWYIANLKNITRDRHKKTVKANVVTSPSNTPSLLLLGTTNNIKTVRDTSFDKIKIPDRPDPRSLYSKIDEAITNAHIKISKDMIVSIRIDKVKGNNTATFTATHPKKTANDNIIIDTYYGTITKDKIKYKKVVSK
jgi:hypothetical protein